MRKKRENRREKIKNWNSNTPFQVIIFILVLSLCATSALNESLDSATHSSRAISTAASNTGPNACGSSTFVGRLRK